MRITDETRPLGLVVCLLHLLCQLLQRQKDVALGYGCARVQTWRALHLLNCGGFMQVCRGTAVMMVSPTAGTEELAQNPFMQADAAS